MTKAMGAMRLLGWILAGVLCGPFADAPAAGFAVMEQGVKGLGNAFAGGAAAAEDSSTIFFNPAGMTRLSGRRIEAAAHLILPSARFEDRGSVLNPGLPAALGGGGPISGGDGGNGANVVGIPNTYYMHSFSDRFKAGVGLNAPFGLITDYEDGWKGRYHALRSDLRTVNINPAVAYRVNDWLSLGAGFSAQYMRVVLSNAIDLSTVCLARLTPATCAGAGLATPGNPASDGLLRLSGTNWGWGYNLGLLLEPTDATRIGLHFRSRVKHDIDGRADFEAPAALIAATGAFTATGAKASLDLPETLSVSAHQQLSRQWAVMADVTWTRWSRFKELRVDFANPSQPTSITPQGWRDAYRYSAGVTYVHNDAWTFRAGAAYDETPVRSPELRTPRVPDADRYWIAAGASYRMSERASIDVGYTHIFLDDVRIHNAEPATGHLLSGRYESHIDILSAQFNWRFH